MKRTAINRKAYIINRKQFLDKGITRCESCGTTYALTIAHRKKRRHYRTLEELTDWNEIILLCQPEHMEIEKDPQKTRELFARLRPDG